MGVSNGGHHIDPLQPSKAMLWRSSDHVENPEPGGDDVEVVAEPSAAATRCALEGLRASPPLSSVSE